MSSPVKVTQILVLLLYVCMTTFLFTEAKLKMRYKSYRAGCSALRGTAGPTAYSAEGTFIHSLLNPAASSPSTQTRTLPDFAMEYVGKVQRGWDAVSHSVVDLQSAVQAALIALPWALRALH
jgi:hypothetical protein